MIRRLQSILTISLLLLIAHSGHSRTVRENTDMLSDGGSVESDLGLIQLIKHKESTTATNCEQLYGFLPCTTNIWGHLFMIVVYSYLLSQGEMYIGSATFRLVQIHGPDSILGGSLFQLLPTIPQLFIVLASGLSASTEMAEQQAAMGMQLLAGSAVMMLTLVWGACLAFGSYNLSAEASSSSSSSNSKLFSQITDFGVIADRKNRWIARSMLVTMIPFIILQLTKVMNSSSGSRLVILVALIVTVSLFILQFIYQISEPRILKWRFKTFLQKHAKDALRKACKMDDMPQKEAIESTFGIVDKDNDKMLTKDELRDFLIRGMELGEHDSLMGIDDFVHKFMREFDSNQDEKITVEEFDNAISNWINDDKIEQEQQYDVSKMKNNVSIGRLMMEYLKASSELIVGSAFLAVLATPYLIAVMNFSVSANISQMWVTYIVIPIAMNFRMALAFVNMARQKNLMLSKLYGIVCMVNLVSLGTFLGLVYARDLTLDVSAEVLVVLIICTTVGVVANFCQKFPFWTCFIAILLYPVSLVLLYVFTIVLGWS